MRLLSVAGMRLLTVAAVATSHVSGSQCADDFNGTLCEYAALEYIPHPNPWTNASTPCPNGYIPAGVSSSWADSPQAMEFWYSDFSWAEFFSWAAAYAWFCPATCNFSNDFRSRWSEKITGDASLENVTTCEFLASNGYCHDSTKEDVEGLQAAFWGIVRSSKDPLTRVLKLHVEATGNTTSPLLALMVQYSIVFSTAWSGAQVRARCPRSCGVCDPSKAVRSSYGQDSDQFCSAPIDSDSETANQSASQEATCMLYLPACCSTQIHSDGTFGRCQGRWNAMSDVVAYGSIHNAFYRSRCGQLPLLMSPAFILAFVGGSALFLVLLVLYGYVVHWYALNMRIVAPRTSLAVVHAVRSRLHSVLGINGATNDVHLSDIAMEASSSSPEVRISGEEEHRKLQPAPLTASDVVGDAPVQLLGVHVGTLAAALDEDPSDEGTQACLSELHTGMRFLKRATGTEGRPLGKLGIVSYRCVRSASDEFTLDGFALRSAVLAAQKACVEFLWLDAWAYRKQPPWCAYSHHDFVRTLLAVMLNVEQVIWLPRSRKDAPGEYQSRIWCTFEATVVHLRHLPVTVAGHPPDWIQTRLIAHGSYLMCWPWDQGCTHASDVCVLGKLNLGFYVMFTAELINLSLDIVRFWNNSSASEWLWTCSQDVVMMLVPTIVWIWGRRRSGAAIMYAKNGNRVLREMTAAASGARRPSVDSDSICVTLPWLAAYDRRDTITIKTVLDDLQRIYGNGHPSISQARATALSVYVHAWLQPSTGDSPAGKTLREWLAQTGIQLFDGECQSLLMADQNATPPGGRSAQTSLARTSSISARSLSADTSYFRTFRSSPSNRASFATSYFHSSPNPIAQRATRPSLALAGWLDTHILPRDHAGAGVVAPSLCTAPLIDTDSSGALDVVELQRQHWTFIRGVQDYVRTPVGLFILEPWAATYDGLIQMRIGARVTLAHTPVATGGLCTVFFYTLAINYICTGVINAITVSNFWFIYPSRNPFWIGGVDKDVSDLAIYSCLSFFTLLLVSSRILVNVRALLHSRTFPLPSHVSGKLEYAASCAAAVTVYYYTFIENNELIARGANVEFVELNDTISLTTQVVISRMWGGFTVNIITFISLTLLCTYEGVVALTHAIAATVRCHDVRLLLECTERRAHHKRQIG